MKIGWIHLSLVALVCYGVVNTGFKYVSRGDPFEASLYLYLSAAVAMAAVVLFTGREVQVNSVAMVAAVLGIFSVLGTLAAIYAVTSAPNPGYVAAIFSTNVVLVTLVSVPLFGTRLSAENAVGVVLAVAAIVLITR